MESQFGLVNMWAQGDIVIRAVAILLLGMSLSSWIVIIIKALDLRTMGKQGKAAAGFWDSADFNEAVGTELPQRGPRTLAGLTFDALGRRPRPGDVAEVDGVRIRVEEVDDLRITKLRVTLQAAAT